MDTSQNHTEVLQCTEKFSGKVASLLKDVFDVEFQTQPARLLAAGLKDENKFFVSILYTGTAYGEYVIAMSEETAAAFLGSSLKGKTGAEVNAVRTEMQDTFGELLNTIVGQSILDVVVEQRKLTMTAPRVYFGKLNYPSIKTGVASVTCVHGQIDCYFYIDRMKLDIASSYAGALESLEVAHAQLQQAMEKLKRQQSLLVQNEKMAALGTMAAGVAHEINTPLAIVKLVGDQLKQLAQDPAHDANNFLRLLDKIDNTIVRISKITNGMRVFAQSARNGSYETISIGELISDALVLCDQIIKKTQVEVRWDEIHAPLTAECRVGEIVQALANVITNACLANENQDHKWIQIDIADRGGEIEIAISDPGPGISQNIVDNIFDPFFTTREIGGGTGLGLSIAKGIMDAHGGGITVDKKSKNTRFVLKLPKVQTAVRAA